MRGSVDWNLGGFGAAVFVNYQNGYRNNLTTPVTRIRPHTTADLNLFYDFREHRGLLSGFRLGLEVTNVFDRDPPFVDIAPSVDRSGGGGGGYDAQAANPIGRIVAISLSMRI